MHVFLRAFFIPKYMADDRLTQLAKTTRNPSEESEYRALLEQSGKPYFQGGNATTSEQAMAALGYGGGGGVSSGNYQDIVNQALKLQQQAIAPAISSLEQSVPEIQASYNQQRQQQTARQQPLERRYQNMLGEIKANQAEEEQRVSTAGAREMGRRGISQLSGFYDQYQNEKLSPVTRYYTYLIKDLGLSQEDAIQELQNQIANLYSGEIQDVRGVRNTQAQIHAGSAQSGIGNAMQLYGYQQQNTQQAIQQAFAQAQFQEQQKQSGIGNVMSQRQFEEQQRQFNAEQARLSKPGTTGPTRLNTQTVTDIYGNQFIISTDPYTGREVSRVQVGQSPSPTQTTGGAGGYVNSALDWIKAQFGL